LRKATTEPAIGVIKQVMGFRRFLLRGLRAAKGEWSLVCSAFNLELMHRVVRFGVNGEEGSLLFVRSFDTAMGLSGVFYIAPGLLTSKWP
jgi:hypothetical protein